MTTPSADSLAVATRVMLHLIGNRWTWPPRQVLEEYDVPSTVSSINCSGRPVSAVLAVTDRTGNTNYQFELSDGFRLRLPELDYSNYGYRFNYPTYDSQGGYYRRGQYNHYVRVSYIYGCRPPLDVQKAIDQFANELDLAGSASCQLPQRVQSLSREGISWTILDPQQFLEGGKLGLYYPDLIISSYGGRVRARARVWSPEHRPPRRLSSFVAPAFA